MLIEKGGIQLMFKLCVMPVLNSLMSAAFPGRVHDSFIWNQSQIKLRLNEGQTNGWLLGNSGYSLEPHLMTPISTTNTPQQVDRSNLRGQSPF